MSKKIIPVLILIALPASGKSEIRKYLRSLGSEVCEADFGLGDTIQLDDFDLVQFMRDFDDVMIKMLKAEPLFFHGLERRFRDEYEWGTLIEYLNWQYSYLNQVNADHGESAAHFIFNMIDQFQLRAGAKMKIGRLPEDLRNVLAEHLEVKAQELLSKIMTQRCSDWMKKTVVIEFARGGARGATMPLDVPSSYQHCLARLSRNILDQAKILYVQVDPAESRRKNFARAVPPPGFEGDLNTYHGTPLEVMLEDYGCDDFKWLLSQSKTKGAIELWAHGHFYIIPAQVFDNRNDLTTFAREDQDKWPEDKAEALRLGLQSTLGVLAAA